MLLYLVGGTLQLWLSAVGPTVITESLEEGARRMSVRKGDVMTEVKA